MKKPVWKRYLDFWGRDVARELDDEFDFHLEMRARELREQGASDSEAREQAVQFFGPRRELRKECLIMHHRQSRVQRLRGVLGLGIRDFLFALRRFRTGNSMSVMVTVTLAVGIGINSAVFSLVQSVLITPLPYPEPQELIRIWDRNVESGLLFFSVSVPHFQAWTEAETLSAVGAYREDSFNLATDSGVDAIRGARVSEGLLRVLGVRPAAGRTLTSEDDTSGSARTLMISDGLWQRFFGRSLEVIGSSLLLDGQSFQIAGVLPATFRFPQQAGLEVLVPYQLDADGGDGAAHFLRVLGRLAPGIDSEAALHELTQLAAQADLQIGEQDQGWSVALGNLQEATVADARDPLLLLMGAVAALLLIACCNVANLYLVQGASRKREFALRSALGASRMAIRRQLLIEVMVASLAGAGLGLALGSVGHRILLTLLPPDLPRRADAAFSWEVGLFALGLALSCGLVIGWVQTRFVGRKMLPVMNLRHPGGSTRRMTRLLVTAEVAVSLALLVGAALLTQSFVRLSRIDPGFATSGVSRASITALASRPEQGTERIRFLFELWDQLNGVAGVEAAALVHRLPLDGNSASTLRPREATWDEREPAWVNYRAISPGYFRVLRIPFLEGRDFDVSEAWRQPRGLIINRALAELFWPGQSGLGKQLAPGSQGPWLEVLGVVADVQEDDLSSPPQPAAYLPYVMAPVPAMEVLVRGDRSSFDLSQQARTRLRELDPHQAMTPFRPLDEFMKDQRAEPRAGSFLVTVFAILATLLALLGVVGLVSASVAGRMHELGVRMVLGATPSGVTALAFRDGLQSAAAGIPLGLLLAWLASGWLASHVFEITATDPVTYIGMAAVLLAGAGAASYFPSRRASRIDPKKVLEVQT